MGADLYIKSVSDPARTKFNPLFDEACNKQDAAATDTEKEEFQKQVKEYYSAMYPENGYFRDSYNSSCLLWQLGLSWWDNVVPMLDDNDYLSVEKTKEFLAMIQEREISETQKESLTSECKIKDVENSLEKWHEMFVQNRGKLIKFLQSAIDKNEPIYCSL